MVVYNVRVVVECDDELVSLAVEDEAGLVAAVAFVARGM